MDKSEKEDKRKIEEYKKQPITDLADATNRSMTGELGELTRGNCLTKIITTVVLIGILFSLFLLF